MSRIISNCHRPCNFHGSSRSQGLEEVSSHPNCVYFVLTLFCSLKLIHTFSAGVDHLLKHPILQESNIPITTSSGIHGPPIAEWTVMNWLVSSRKHSLSYEAQKLHVWEDKAPYTKGIHDQVGKKVGILGYGSIGRQSMFHPRYVYTTIIKEPKLSFPQLPVSRKH
jgi:hypothetical protein